MATIKTYTNSAERNRVDKTNFIELVDTYTGTFRSSVDIVNPIITLTNIYPASFNYVYIQELNRFYFVENISIVRNNCIEVELSLDVLMTYKDAIRTLNAFVLRNEFDFNNEIVDTKRVVEQGTDIEEIICDPALDDNITFSLSAYAVELEANT